MNIFVPVDNHQQLMSCFCAKVSAVIFSTAFCSTKTLSPLSIKELSSLSIEAAEMKLPWYLSINRMILQSEWATLQNEINRINDFHPAGYIVSDVGVMYYLKQNFSDKKIIMQTDTTITNAQDVEVLLDIGADFVALARELTFDEVREIVRIFGNRVLISGFGYQSMSTSNRSLLSNYFEHIRKDVDVYYKRFTLQEEGRMERYPAMQDAHGFHIFTSSILEVFDEVAELEALGLERLMIDRLFIDDETIRMVIDTFQKRMDVDRIKAEISVKYKLSKALYYTPTSASKVVSE
jgi:putative protease